MLMEYFNKPMTRLNKASPPSSFWSVDIVLSIFTQLTFHLLGLYKLILLCRPWDFQIPKNDKPAEVPIMVNTVVF